MDVAEGHRDVINIIHFRMEQMSQIDDKTHLIITFFYYVQEASLLFCSLTFFPQHSFIISSLGVLDYLDN